MTVLSKIVPGTQGYSEDAESLIPRHESVSFVEKYNAVLHLLPAKASSILDISAGTGVDAAWLSTKGHRVLAVEPTDAIRKAGAERHPSSQIDWLDDSLPTLTRTMARKEAFDLVLVTAVWVHLSEIERQQALPNIVALLRPSALLIMSLRHGPAPANRRVFSVTAGETIELAQQNGLRRVLHQQTQSTQPINRQTGVMRSWLAFQK